MRFGIVLTALCCGLIYAASASAEVEAIKIVPTMIGLRVEDQAGQPLVLSDSTFVLVLDQFGKRVWPKDYWATVVLHRTSEQQAVPIRFPVNTAAIRRLGWYAKFFHSKKVTIGCALYDRHGHPLVMPTGVRITLNQIGDLPWPNGSQMVITGNLDALGHIQVPVDFPLHPMVVQNLNTLAKQ